MVMIVVNIRETNIYLDILKLNMKGIKIMEKIIIVRNYLNKLRSKVFLDPIQEEEFKTLPQQLEQILLLMKICLNVKQDKYLSKDTGIDEEFLSCLRECEIPVSEDKCELMYFVQCILICKGYESELSGFYSPSTKKGVRKFISDNRIRTGSLRITSILWEILFS